MKRLYKKPSVMIAAMSFEEHIIAYGDTVSSGGTCYIDHWDRGGDHEICYDIYGEHYGNNPNANT